MRLGRLLLLLLLLPRFRRLRSGRRLLLCCWGRRLLLLYHALLLLLLLRRRHLLLAAAQWCRYWLLPLATHWLPGCPPWRGLCLSASLLLQAILLLLSFQRRRLPLLRRRRRCRSAPPACRLRPLVRSFLISLTPAASAGIIARHGLWDREHTMRTQLTPTTGRSRPPLQDLHRAQLTCDRREVALAARIAPSTSGSAKPCFRLPIAMTV